MRVGIATDHGGSGLKVEFVAQLRWAGHQVVDFGARDLNPEDDYPDFVIPLAKGVAARTVNAALRRLAKAASLQDQLPGEHQGPGAAT